MPVSSSSVLSPVSSSASRSVLVSSSASPSSGKALMVLGIPRATQVALKTPKTLASESESLSDTWLSLGDTWEIPGHLSFALKEKLNLLETVHVYIFFFYYYLLNNLNFNSKSSLLLLLLFQVQLILQLTYIYTYSFSLRPSTDFCILSGGPVMRHEIWNNPKWFKDIQRHPKTYRAIQVALQSNPGGSPKQLKQSRCLLAIT
jgi:hypothetical protein